jgi:hypothetical protein
MDENLIEKAKKYAREQKKSVSRVVSEYFSLLDHRSSEACQEIPPVSKSLLGVMRGSRMDEIDSLRSLEEKYR